MKKQYSKNVHVSIISQRCTPSTKNCIFGLMNDSPRDKISFSCAHYPETMLFFCGGHTVNFATKEISVIFPGGSPPKIFFLRR